MTETFTIRPSNAADLPALDALVARSYGILMKRDYPPSILVTALPLIARAQPRLLTSGSYYVAVSAEGALVSAGGWTHQGPQGGVGPRDLGHIRLFATDPDATRKGLARAIMRHSLKTAAEAGITRLICQSSCTAVPFYTAMGFERQGEIEITLRPGISFPAMQMVRSL
ncbi:GNAT family N-acetyltransferase [Rhodophyticola sp. CCM32]|uniref:GNAT family N-acetyltransferase n=1 Tax=Rhodophyticola sp. CCM32 TaxID=2916397 RepID=UPI00107EEC2A|nr:GNAT family N-acetyltransferase [Rhodophyticola sp. CCM32]QBY01102.1 GNAT family N-acetyltransferase [Rhodophyticola sp. CCM32]